MLNVEDLGYVAKETLFGDKEIREKLIEIKKDMLKDFIETIKNNKPDIKNLWERLENYLINDGSVDDVFQDIFRWCKLSSEIPEYMDIIEKHKLKEKMSSIQDIPTSEKLSTLKAEILSIWSEIQSNSDKTNTNATSAWIATWTGIETSTWIEEEKNEFIKSVYNRVSQQIWKPYSRWWIAPSSGFDCSGLRYRAFKEEWIKFSERLNAHAFSDADVDLKKDQVKAWDFMFWDQKPWWKKKHDSIYHIEMIISKPYTKNWKTYVRTLWSSTDAKDDCGNYVGKWVQIREREMKDYRHYGRPTYYYQLAQYKQTGSNENLIAWSNKPSHNLETQVLSA